MRGRIGRVESFLRPPTHTHFTTEEAANAGEGGEISLPVCDGFCCQRKKGGSTGSGRRSGGNILEVILGWVVFEWVFVWERLGRPPQRYLSTVVFYPIPILPRVLRSSCSASILFSFNLKLHRTSSSALMLYSLRGSLSCSVGIVAGLLSGVSCVAHHGPKLE